LFKCINYLISKAASQISGKAKPKAEYRQDFVAALDAF